jgi:hypothetical protein
LNAPLPPAAAATAAGAGAARTKARSAPNQTEAMRGLGNARRELRTQRG